MPRCFNKRSTGPTFYRRSRFFYKNYSTTISIFPGAVGTECTQNGQRETF